MKLTEKRLKEIISQELRNINNEVKLTEGKESYVVWSPLLNKVYDGPVSEKKALMLIKKYAKQGQYHVGMLGTKYFNKTKLGKKKPVQEDFGMSARQLPTFSSKEAKTVMDKSVREYAKLLRKAEYNIIKDWMSKAKSGVIDYFDIVRGLQTGDASRAHPFESRFLKGILDRDKIMNRFRSYFGGKKGKPRK